MTDDPPGAILDASAVLAYLRGEPGEEVVEAELNLRALINSVNYAEVLSRMADTGQEPEMLHRLLRERGLTGGLLTVVPLVEEDGLTIARLRPLTRACGLSLGDRACLATALRLGRPALTADRGWAALDIGVPIRLIRP